MKNRVTIIGSGLGGLQCGYILAKHGLEVTVLEQHNQIGGCLQNFTREGMRFDCGFHCAGALGEGESLHTLFNYFGLSDLQWKQLDPEYSEEVVIGCSSFPLASSHEGFVSRLAGIFPHQSKELDDYSKVLRSIGDGILETMDAKKMSSLFSRSAKQFLSETISDPLLRKVLAGSSLKMELSERLPLYVFAQINDSFIRSAWKLVGGGPAITKRLAGSIEAMGGRILSGSRVTGLETSGGKIKGVEVGGKEMIGTEWVISDIHPSLTVKLVKGQSAALRQVYRWRMTSLENTTGMLSVNLVLKSGAVRHINRNLFIHKEEADLWRPDHSKTESVMVHFYPEDAESGYATHLDILSPLDGCELPRDESYPERKMQKAKECIALAGQRLPELESAIESIYVSTPQTWADYTLSPGGTAYGIRKDFTSSLTTFISPRTPVENLLLTGQNLNLHGLLGVSMTSVLTSGHIIGEKTLSKKISEHK